ncbi:caspase family protein [Roseibium sp. HPY-6]|uniref:caspase family protein n=1 Tax=Roseibium sp. HPY-6 TaxID=3229852 RepID=UPI00338F3A45
MIGLKSLLTALAMAAAVLLSAIPSVSQESAQNSLTTNGGQKVEVSGELSLVSKTDGDKEEDAYLDELIDITPELLSSIAIALVGYWISQSINKSQQQASKATAEAQIEAANIRAENQVQLQRGELTGKLMEHLTSSDRTTRELAVVALRESVSPEIYEPIVSILAKSDRDGNVRAAAIRELGTSQNQAIARQLNAIGRDETRSESERRLAMSSASAVSLSSDVPTNTAIITATSWGEHAYEVAELDGGVFTYFLLKSFNEWRSKEKGTLYLKDLFRSLERQMKIYRADSRPTLFVEGNSKIPIAGDEAHYTGLEALVIGIDKYASYPLENLSYCRSDAEKVTKTLESLTVPDKNIQSVYDEEATARTLSSHLSKLAHSGKEGGLFIVYFAGHSFLSFEGELGLVTHDWKPDTREGFIPVSTIKSAFDQSRSSTRLLILDTDNAATVERQFQKA